MGKSPNASGEQRVAYIKQQGYDEFEQKVYRRLGNDTETTYTYDPVMRRLSSLVAHRDTPVAPSVFQNNRYSYDLVGNILSVENTINHQLSTINQLGGSSKYTYEYDELNRLIKAKGTFEGTSNKADYELNMQYNRLNGIVQKALQYTLNGQDKGYTLDYEYDNPKHPHAPSLIAESGKPKARQYQYDGNGNPTYYDEFKGFRYMVWDEENRLRGINDNGRLHLYTYDHTGERALKSSAESSMAVINGLASAVITHTEDYTAYVSPYFVVQKGKFTKHFFEGSSRIVSKLGEGTFSHKNTGIMAGGLDYLKRTQKEQEARDRYIKGLNTPPGPPTQHGIYATPEWTGQPYPSIDWESISQNQEPPAGWPRYPRFNEPGDVPGPPVQFGPPVTNANVKAGHGFIPNGVEEKNLYYYHPDHLGSSSYITDKNGEVIQHTEYMAFGEVLVDEHSTTNKMPYLFNGKELDFETGLYYYGARYYDPKTSIFLNVDPLVEKTMSPYAYVNNNPVNLIDPDGREGIVISGQPGGHKNKEHFLINGLDRAKKALNKRQNKNEKVTWIVFNDKSTKNGHDEKMLNTYQEKAKKLGINFKVVNSVKQIEDYINTKGTAKNKERDNDKITSFYYIGHSVPSTLNPGYPNKNGAFDPDKIREGVFSSGAWVNCVGGCRTDIDDSWIFDDSVVDKFQNKVDEKSTIHGSNVRVQYDGGVRTDEQLLKENNGKIITVKGKRK